MADLAFLIITVSCFAVAAGFVSLCDRVIGPDPDRLDPTRPAPGSRSDSGSGDDDDDAVAAATPVAAGADPSGAVR